MVRVSFRPEALSSFLSTRHPNDPEMRRYLAGPIKFDVTPGETITTIGENGVTRVWIVQANGNLTEVQELQ